MQRQARATVRQIRDATVGHVRDLLRENQPVKALEESRILMQQLEDKHCHRDKEGRIHVLSAHAKALMLNEKFDEEIEIYLKIQTLDAFNWTSYICQATCLQKTQSYEKAFEVIDKFFTLAKTPRKVVDTNKAAPYTRLTPTHRAQAFHLLGLIHSEYTFDNAKVIENAKKSIEADNDYAPAWSLLAKYTLDPDERTRLFEEARLRNLKRFDRNHPAIKPLAQPKDPYDEHTAPRPRKPRRINREEKLDSTFYDEKNTHDGKSATNKTQIIPIKVAKSGEILATKNSFAGLQVFDAKCAETLAQAIPSTVKNKKRKKNHKIPAELIRESMCDKIQQRVGSHFSLFTNALSQTVSFAQSGLGLFGNYIDHIPQKCRKAQKRKELVKEIKQHLGR